MKAARFYRSKEPIRIEEVPVPDIRAGEVLIRVLRAGVNGGDVGMMRGVHDHTLPPNLPMTIGHDGCGEVVDVGPDVHNVRTGDRVVTKPTLTCGFCKYCRSEREYLCLYSHTMGFLKSSTTPDIFARYTDGLWAEYCRLPATNVERLHPEDDVDTFSLVSQLAVPMRALKIARLEAGETVIVNGATGVTGIPAVLTARVMGAGQIIAVARDPVRLARLQAICPQVISTVSILTESIPERVAELTAGEGAGVLVDLNPGAVESTIDCLNALEWGGRAVLLAGNPAVLQIPYLFLLKRCVEITSCRGRNYEDIHQLLELTRRGLLDLSPIQPRFFALEDVTAALDVIANRGSNDPVWPMMRTE
jgi:threonine dehydrogenase-like Zn-dependent dehydrogenase